jgi:hypothetical protein
LFFAGDRWYVLGDCVRAMISPWFWAFAAFAVLCAAGEMVGVVYGG